MKKKLIVCLVICLIPVIVFSSLWVNLRIKNRQFEKKYIEKILVSDYRGAIDIAIEWTKSIKNHRPAITALANAYLMNFEPRKAAEIAQQFTIQLESSSKYNKGDIAKGYYMMAYFECQVGDYERANSDYYKLSNLDPELYRRSLTQRYLCKMDELMSNNKCYHGDQRCDELKNEIVQYVKNTQNDQDDTQFNKAMLAYYIDNIDLALKFAMHGYEAAEMQTKKILGNKKNIPFNLRERMAIFYLLAGDNKKANDEIGCATDCHVDDMLQQGHDPFYLASYFVLIADMKSAEVCMKAHWQRMKTAEQKEQFFKYIYGGHDVKAPWKAFQKIEWVKNEYNKFMHRG